MSEPILPPAAGIRNIAELARLAGVHAGTVSRANRLASERLMARGFQRLAFFGEARTVTGFDDLPFAEQTVPRLTTVRQDIATREQAMEAALFARIAGEDAPSVEMQPVLVARDTA